MLSLAYLQPDDVGFPDPDSALTDPDGLLAAGGDLTPSGLLRLMRGASFHGLSAMMALSIGGVLLSGLLLGLAQCA